MLDVPFTKSFISTKVANKLIGEATENYMRKIVEFRELPETIQAFEARFQANGYVYETPMTNEMFKEMAKAQLKEKSADPLEVNNLADKLKTAYTNHFLEYMNKKNTLKKFPEVIAQFEGQIQFIKNIRPTLLQKILSILPFKL